jgi:signal transduction histidine kinase
VEFTRFYQDIGVKAPEWQDLETVFSRARSQIALEGIAVESATGRYQVYADPLIEKVFYNMLENSLRHGEHVTSIRLSAQENTASLHVVYEDDGAGVPSEIKEKLFQRGFGKHTGLGLFLTREILAITGITVTENGEPGKGARFEIIVPAGGFRLRKE